MRNLLPTFGLNPQALSSEDRQRLKVIEDYFKDKDESEIRRLENSLGMTDLGEKRLEKVYRHVCLKKLLP